MKFNEEQVGQIMYDGVVYDNEKKILRVVMEKMTDNDQEKNSVTTNYVIQEIETGKFYTASLSESPWCDQAQANASVEWREVYEHKEVKTVLSYHSKPQKLN